MAPKKPVLRRTSLGALLAVVALGFLMGLAWLTITQYQSSSSHVAFTELRAQSDRVQHLDTLMLRVIDAESGVRGYLLTADPSYLRPWETGRAEIDAALEALRDNLTSRSQLLQLDALEAMVNSRWALLSHVVATGLKEGFTSEQAGMGRSLTEDIRMALAELRGETALAIENRLQQSFDQFAQARKQTFALGLGVLVLLIVLVVMIYRQERLRSQMADILHSENERLQRQVAARTAELSDLATYLTNAREAEQERLARELHDELGSLLTAVKMDASWIARKLPAEAMAPLRSRFDRLFDSLSQVISLKRKVVANLRPPLLSDLGLLEALRSMAQSGDVGEHGGVLTLELPEHLPELAPEVSLALYRVAQEALTNVRRYAQATQVVLSLQIRDDLLLLRIQDNGVGFDPARRPANRHGLVGMAHRAQMMSGRLTIRSAPGEGTMVQVEVPREHWR